ncbi:precorrin-6y C5,15-methyltransferase (decarboxylating) subunit CbiE [Pseudonocardia sp. KRD291]|uniref:precorrin-6y C5,15-methyltransferase (decarboxylating) subunit CbiE n=1 Tax=Pseudonocardia sp. KRD291 TaxID=2792007 RepID=UPI001C49FCFF|nr:precorrin-6y C5,15-methyltransferase (decarboxylating) subunit CbiE [Pseudonocardia sp. KRD291]MBW0104922.1 precorrin-6y C5,15-methyltransferase (decarboxylating) subunit CbiE [Pseudonocardia sp. KRD291]
MGEPVTVVGIGAEGWPGLAEPSRDALRAADVVLGGPRQLDLLDDSVPAVRRAWPSPLVPALPGILDELAGSRVAVLASGDPMFFGIGTTLARVVGPQRLRVLPHPSSISLACARLGWAVQNVELVSVVGRPLARLRRALAPGARVLVLSSGAGSPAEVAELVAAQGFGRSTMTVLERLGEDGERVVTGTAGTWSGTSDALNVVALDCVADPGACLTGETPGLPDDAYDSDGQLTKREVRAVTLAHLAPRPGELLWDVGGGAGSVGIEWMRAHRTCRTITVESRPERAGRITANAAALGVPELRVVTGSAPEALHGLPRPDAVFVGGGLTRDGVLQACWDALAGGGRLVANAVTVQTEAALAAAHERYGGRLVRLQVSRAEPVGRAAAGGADGAGSTRFHGWRPAMPVTIWSVEATVATR